MHQGMGGNMNNKVDIKDPNEVARLFNQMGLGDPSVRAKYQALAAPREESEGSGSRLVIRLSNGASLFTRGEPCAELENRTQ